jgi:hypothetical protein
MPLVLVLACAPPTGPTGSVAERWSGVGPAPRSAAAPVVSFEHVDGAAPPTLTASVPPGAHADAFEVEIATTDGASDIWYTLDATNPVAGVSARYEGPITISSSTLLRAISSNEWGTGALAVPWVLIGPDLVGFSSNLPLLVLWSEAEAPDVKVEAWTPYTLLAFEPDGDGRTDLPGDAVLGTRAGLKIRGSSSAWYPKHPYRLEAWQADSEEDQDISLLGMPEEGDWVLAAPLDFDRALMRDPLVYAWSNAVGRYASRTVHAELFLAERGEAVGLDDYAGVYVATESIERDGERVDITKLLPTDLFEPEVTGGYIFKEDRTGPGEWGFTAGTAGGLLDFQQPFVYVDPSEDEIMGAQAAYLTEQLDELGVALTSPGFVHPETGRHYEEIVDVDAFIDHHILNVLPKNPDAFRLSGYFHKDREGPIHAGPVWDFDRTMGCNSDSRCDQPTWWDASNITTDCTYVFEHGFYGGLFDDPVFVERWAARIAELWAGALALDTILAGIDANEALLAEAAERNFAEWSDYPPDGGFEGEVQTLRDWLTLRHEWIEECLDLPNPVTCRGE